MKKISFEGKEYELEQLSDQAKNISKSLKLIDDKIRENANIQALLTKAKRAYISELKTEMLSSKAGFNFTED